MLELNESGQILVMSFRLLSFALVTTLLISCTPLEQEKYPAYHYGTNTLDEVQKPKKVILPIAEPKGFNINMMDKHLAEMVDEAMDIEEQVSVLLGRLNMLRDEILGYALIRKESVIAEPSQVSYSSNVVIKDNEKPIPLAQPEVKRTSQQVNFVENKKPLPTSDKRGVITVRYGLHANKTRLVFDVNGATTHEVKYDVDAGIITVNLPDTIWSTEVNKTYKLQQLQGYEAKQDNQGTVIAIAVSDTTSVKAQSLPKSSSKPARIIIDLYK